MIVRSHGGSYQVLIGSLADIPEMDVALVDANVHRLWADRLNLPKRVRVIPSGEQSKSFSVLEATTEWLGSSGVTREDRLLVLGGGVTGDLGGLVAGLYMRGIPYVQVPTTLLAMVDSSVGGKVAIDLGSGKNLAGMFYPPTAVYIATDFLSTLPVRQIRNGMAEVLKYGFIIDTELLTTLDLNSDNRDHASLIRRCVELKANVVEQDEMDVTGLRAILNFGHTIGHAVELLTGYSEVLHGEAISIGMVVEARLGELLGITSPQTSKTISERLLKEGLPVTHPCLAEADQIVNALQADKKTGRHGLAFSLLTRIGECKLVKSISPGDVKVALLTQ